MANNTHKKYAVKYKGAKWGIVAYFDRRGEAVAAVELYEEIDRDAGIYEPDMYEIAVRTPTQPKGFVYITI